MFTIIDIFFFFFFGAILGSFLNVLVSRRGTGLSVVHGRSRCFHCGKKLQWFELIPIISFLLQRGRCRSCRARISAQYIVAELCMGLLVLGIAYTEQLSVMQVFTHVHDATLFVLLTTIAFVALMIALYDAKHFIIPLLYNALFFLLTFTYAVWQYVLGERIMLDFFAPFALAAPILILFLVSKGKWVGFADSILFASVGLFLGFVLGIHAFVYAFWVGALVSLFLIQLSKKYSLQSAVPFGPFIITGLYLAYFMQNDFFGISLLL